MTSLGRHHQHCHRQRHQGRQRREGGRRAGSLLLALHWERLSGSRGGGVVASVLQVPSDVWVGGAALVDEVEQDGFIAAVHLLLAAVAVATLVQSAALQCHEAC